MIDILNLDSLEVLARERLEPSLFDYIAGGAGDEWTLHENRAAWSRVQLLPRMLRGRRRTTGQYNSARNASLVSGSRRTDGIPRVVPSRGRGSDGARNGGGGHDLLREHGVEPKSRDDRRRRPGGPRWFQLYVYRDRGMTSRARRARRRRRLQRPVPDRGHAAGRASRTRSPKLAAHAGAPRARELSVVAHGAAPSRRRQGLGAGPVHRVNVGSGPHLGGRRVAAIDLATARDRQRHSRAAGRGARHRAWRGWR